MALLLGSAVSHAQTTPAVRDNPYVPLVRSARQVIVHAPTISDGNLVNALKLAKNQGVPTRVITTDDGLMQPNGHVLTLIVLNVPVFRVPSGGERRTFMEIETDTGRWTVYDLSGGVPVQKRMYDFQPFNVWFAANAKKLPQFVPESCVAVWAQAYLGYQLSASSVEFKSRNDLNLNPPPGR